MTRSYPIAPKLNNDVQRDNKIIFGTNTNQNNGVIIMDTRKELKNEVNLLRQDFCLFLTDEEKKMNLLKVEIKRILKQNNILFSDIEFGICIEMFYKRHIIFSSDPLGYTIYTDSGFELGCSTDEFMTKNNIFEALGWTILEINLDKTGDFPFNVYANNGEVA